MPVEHLHVNFLFISMHFALEMGMVSYKNRNGYVHESFIYIYIYSVCVCIVSGFSRKKLYIFFLSSVMFYKTDYNLILYKNCQEIASNL